MITCVNLDPVRRRTRASSIVPPEIGLPAAFDVSDLLGDAVFTWRVGQQLRAPRAGPAAGAPAARGVVTPEARALDGAGARAALVRREVAPARGRSRRRRRRRWRPDCTLALFEVAFADGESELYQLPYRTREDGGAELALADPALAGALLGALRGSDSARHRCGRRRSSSSRARCPSDRCSRRCAPSAASSPTARSCSASG